MSEPEFAGKVAFVTGAARGFGRAFCEALSAQGAAVWLADVDLEEAERAAAAIRQAGGDARAVRCDVSDEREAEAALEAAAAAHGGLDILINNAGLHSEAYNQPMAAMGLAKLRRLFDVNVMGVIVCSLAAHPLMRGRAGASIVNISSTASYGCTTAYGASKLAVRGLTATLAREFGADGIRVNAIAPGLIFTDTIRAELSAQNVQAVMRQQFIPREGAVDDIVQAMLHLVSDRASFVTGETVRVGGGFALAV
jgi:NAD(P)-dependent dehydrogenase (short-subunit alcohol dehydrogenase family)